MRVTAMMVSVLVAGSVACGPSGGDVSEGTVPHDVPAALALTLLSSAPGESRIFVGDAPTDVEAVLPPTGDLPLLGGVTRGNGGTLVFEVDALPEAALSDYAETIEGEGWERAPDDRGLQGGFLPSPEPIAGTWCTDAHWIRASSVSLGDRHYLRVWFYDVGAEPTPCENAQMRAQMPMGHRGLRLPLLQAPAEAEVQMTGGGGSSNGVSMDALVVTGLSTEELFDHYARQVERNGWHRGSSTSSDRLAMGSWSAQDEYGEPAVGVLAVWRLPQDENHRALLRLDRGPLER
ncbi:MAG: hypothetical protein HKN72_00810 [Gemmatimonadetes bacterium]|nr:hypothetical protein [Gemmatimonadota bacterium]